MKKVLFMALFSAFFVSCAVINTSKEVISESKFSIDRVSKENIIEFPTIEYANVSKKEKRIFNTSDIPHVMDISYLFKVIISQNNQKLYVLQCAFSAKMIKGQPFRIEKMFNKEEQMLKAVFDGASQISSISFDWKPNFDFLAKGNVDIDNNPLVFFEDAKTATSYAPINYSVNYDLDVPATIYYSIPIPREYLEKHKDDGIIIKAYARGRYGRMFFHIAPFYIQGVLEKAEAVNYTY
jgi:hypothetical protein